jgi:putative nucleotidyltransferase with HDIG domain
MTTLDTLIDQVEGLPSAPQILPKLLAALDEPDADVSRITDLVSFDPGLTARLLQVCNSASFSGGSPVTDIGEAVNRVGLREIYRLTAGLAGRSTMQPSKPIPGFDADALWKHCVTAALAAQLMAQDQGDDASSVFTATLLHDAGKVIMASAHRERYTRLLQHGSHSPQSLVQQEQILLGVHHADAGARLLEKWNFPAEMVAGVKHYPSPSQAGTAQRMAAYVHLGDALACQLEAPDTAPAPEALEALGQTTETFAQYRDRTLENFEFVNALCRL